MLVKLLVLALYALMMVGLALFSRKNTSTLNEFFLGDRKTGAWFSAFAYGTTYFSAVIFIGYAGKTGWEMGMPALWIAVGNALIGNLLAWQVLAKRTRSITHHLNSSTMPEFFEQRYKSKPMKIVAALVIFVFLVPYCASVYQGLSYLFETAFGIPYIYCMLIMAGLTAFYLVVGGYGATVLADFVQGCIMVIGVIIMMCFVVFSPQVGGLAEGMNRLAAIDPTLITASGPKPWDLICLVLITSIGSWGMPQMIHKFYAVRDVKAIKQATVISTVFALLIAGGAYLNGAFSRLFLNNTIPAAGTDSVIPTMLTTAMPEWGLALVVVLVLSASMSTLASLVLVSSSALSIDLLKGVLMPNMSQKSATLSMRVLCGVFVLASFLVASQRFTAVLTLMNFSWGTIAGAFLSPFLLGLYWKGVTKIGAWTGLLGGMSTCLILAIFVKLPTSQAGIWAMCASMALTVIVSLVTPKFDKAHIEHVFAATKTGK